MGESQNYASKTEELIQQHEAKARQLEEQARVLAIKGDPRAGEQARALQEQARRERQEAANLRNPKASGNTGNAAKG